MSRNHHCGPCAEIVGKSLRSVEIVITFYEMDKVQFFHSKSVTHEYMKLKTTQSLISFITELKDVTVIYGKKN